MNAYYTHTSKSWYPDEDGRLMRAYKYQQITLIQLAQIHKRAPSAIIKRLKKLGIIKYTQQVKGYDEYINSDMYFIMKEGCQSQEELLQEGLLQEGLSQEQQPEQNPDLQPIIEGDEEADLEDYSNTNKPWLKEEEEQLMGEYTMEMLSLMAIAENHNRHPADIIAKLKALKIVKTLNTITGYNIYKMSHLYSDHQKELRERQKAQKAKAEEEQNPLTPLKKDLAEIKSEIVDLRSTIVDLKSLFSEMFKFIRSVFSCGPQIRHNMNRLHSQ
jgi:hypothetical protein